jgi:RNA polymerase sigma-70 factor, ECF subfamily
MDSLELVALLKQNKEKGLSCLYDQYAPALNGMVVRMVVSEAQAEEVLQKTFLKIAHSIDSYHPESGSLFTWMSRIARQEASDTNRSEKTSTSLLSAKTLTYEPLVSDMREEYKAVLDRIYLLGYTPAETAKELNIPLDTVKSRLHAAVNHMRDFIKNDSGQLLHKTLFITLSLGAVS